MSQADDNPHELLIEQALAEYMNQCDSGGLPDREAFLKQHPELREQLAEILDAADWIEDLAGPTISDLAFNADVSEADIDETLPHVSAVAGRTPEATVHDSGASSSRPRELSQPLLPCQFGEYVLERVLGRGGMGVVYFGRQVHLERPVAIKMIRSGALASDEEVQRFYGEARNAAKLDHPNIVTVYQCGEHDGHRYFSMDFVEGTDLSKIIAQAPMEPKRAARYVRDVARAIQYAHERGILHRDLKPANVLIDQDDRVRITDFGLAKSIGHDTGLTATGAALGTPSYMSPEQAAGKVDEQHHATDIYSLGAILFTALTGRPPFKASGVVQTIMQVIHRPAPMLRSVDQKLDADIETIVDVCLQKSPDRRYSSAGELAEDLNRYLDDSPIEARPMPRLRRAWYWLLGVPIFGAILDHRVVEPSDAHRWVQRGLISLALLLAVTWMAIVVPSKIYKNRMPNTVTVAAGFSGGEYELVAQAICNALAESNECSAIPINTGGSSDNADRLERGEVDLALLQHESVRSGSLAVLAPLYYEAVHILVRSDLVADGLQDLNNRHVVVGPDKAGSHSVARLLLGSAGLSFDDIQVDTDDWHDLKQEPDADAAIIVSKLGSDDVAEVLCSGKYRLLAMPNAIQFALDEPSFHTLLVKPEHYPDCGLPETGIATVTTTAFLVARAEAPSVLVTTVLQHLFRPEIVAATGIISAERAAHWQNLAWHPAAREFFQPYRGEEPAAD